MAVNYSADVENDRMFATRDYHANGDLQILDGATVLVTFGLSASGGTVSGDTWTLVLDNPTVSATGAGTADGARIRNSGGTVGVTGLTVGTSGADINLDNTSISAGQNVTLSSFTIQHA
ncbi:MAG: hypothetical protein AAGB23_05255 [Pseudomonadota bacterium]